MTRHDLVEHSPSCKYLAAHCFIKQQKFDEALNILGEKNPAHLIASSKTRRKLHHRSEALRNGAKAGKAAVRDRIEKSEERDREDMLDIKFEAAMCYLRGICYAKQNAFDRAKECYKDAVRIDVQCFEAFDQLMKNSLMSPDEEWAFLESLDFDSIAAPDADASTAQEAAQFVKMLYTTRLSKYKNPQEFMHASETLGTHYRLAENHDLLLAKAELSFTQCRFNDALAITSSVLDMDEYNFAIYPLHLACLAELQQTNRLFLLAHQLADLHPHEPATWLAVGVYYLVTNRIAEARRFFSKASMMDPHFGPAWIGFAHTFAAEGEHDQAISAYSTAARLFQGTHLPQLFLGMQNLQLNNLTLAQEYLTQAYGLCKSDPLVLNELGVCYYHLDNLEHAARFFTAALQMADEVGADPKAWTATRANLGHAYRRQNMWDQALEQFNHVLRTSGKDAAIFTAKGLVLLETQQAQAAVVAFHDALGVQPQDPVATDLLQRALDELGNSEILGAGRIEDAMDDAFDGMIAPWRDERQDTLQRISTRRQAGVNAEKEKPRYSTVRQSAVSMMISDDDD